jgi:hypothetical protein
MRPNTTYLGIALVITSATLTGCGGSAPVDVEITDLAPAAAGVNGWTPVGEPQIFEGDALFELINGGAEIYHEFGFQRALSQDFTGPEQRYIALEIFEMTDAAAACGTYTFKTGVDGQVLDLGDEAMLEDYYLNVRRGRYLVTVTGMASDETTIAAITDIAAAVAEAITIGGTVPKPAADMMARDPAPERVFYLRGELALGNVEPRLMGLQLGMTEGAAALFDDRTEVVLHFADAAQARLRFAEIASEFADRPGWTLTEERAVDAALFADGAGTRLDLSTADDTIVVVVRRD